MNSKERLHALKVLALMGFALLLVWMLVPQAKADPYYTKEQLLEVVPLVHTVVSIGSYNKRAAEIGLVDQIVVPEENAFRENGIYRYCLRQPYRSTRACTWNGAIYLSRGAGAGTIFHELKHVRRQFIEGRSLTDERDHIGWD